MGIMCIVAVVVEVHDFHVQGTCFFLSAPMDKAVTLVEMKANKKLIQQQFSQEIGNKILVNNLTHHISPLNFHSYI